MAVIPYHDSCLRARDFVPYVAAPVRGRAYRQLELRDIWRGRLDGRALVPTPSGRYAFHRFLERCRERDLVAPGDEVILAGFNLYAIVRILTQFGLVPRFADIELPTLCLDPARIEERITSRTRMVFVTHMFGNPADVVTIADLCRARGLLLFEDCALAVGAHDATGLHVGNRGDGALFSFGLQKIVNTFGGGMLAGDVSFLGDLDSVHSAMPRMRSFASTLYRAFVSSITHPALVGALIQPMLRVSRAMARRGWSRLNVMLEPARQDPAYRFHPEDRPPFKDFMRRAMELQVMRLDENVRRRRAIRAEIRERLAGIEEIGWLDEDRYGRSNAALFGVLVPSPPELYEWLVARGVQTNPREFYNCAELEQFAEYAADCPASSRAAAHLIRLPSHPELTPREIDRIVNGVTSFFMQPHSAHN